MYKVPFVSPLKLQLSTPDSGHTVGAKVQVAPPGESVTVYSVMLLPRALAAVVGFHAAYISPRPGPETRFRADGVFGVL